MFKKHLVIVSIKYSKNYKVKLIGFSDNDWAGCVDNMMGTSKYIIFNGFKCIYGSQRSNNWWLNL